MFGFWFQRLWRDFAKKWGVRQAAQSKKHLLCNVCLINLLGTHHESHWSHVDLCMFCLRSRNSGCAPQLGSSHWQSWWHHWYRRILICVEVCSRPPARHVLQEVAEAICHIGQGSRNNYQPNVACPKFPVAVSISGVRAQLEGRHLDLACQVSRLLGGSKRRWRQRLL